MNPFHKDEETPFTNDIGYIRHYPDTPYSRHI